MKLTEKQKTAIKIELYKKIKNSDTRSKIIATAFGFAEENGEDGDLESMVSYLMRNQDKINEMYMSYGMTTPYVSEKEKPSKKKKKNERRKI